MAFQIKLPSVHTNYPTENCVQLALKVSEPGSVVDRKDASSTGNSTLDPIQSIISTN